MAKRLLFLNPISEELIESFNNEQPKLKIECTPLIVTKEIPFEPSILDTTKPWVFTSQVAVKTVKKYPLSKTVYCVGEKTADGLTNAITPAISNAKELAKLIIQNNENSSQKNII